MSKECKTNVPYAHINWRRTNRRTETEKPETIFAVNMGIKNTIITTVYGLNRYNRNPTSAYVRSYEHDATSTHVGTHVHVYVTD